VIELRDAIRDMERRRYYAIRDFVFLSHFFGLDNSWPPISIVHDAMQSNHTPLLEPTNTNSDHSDINSNDDSIPPLYDPVSGKVIVD
jgi:hypothetical protein